MVLQIINVSACRYQYCIVIKKVKLLLHSCKTVQDLAWETLSGGQNSISNLKTLLLAKCTFSYISNTENRVKH